MQNSRTFSAGTVAFSETYSPELVDWAWRSVGVPLEVFRGPPTFLPYRLQAEMAETLARRVGEPHVGAIATAHLRYANLDIYGGYVLASPRLDEALRRGTRALRFILHGAEVHLDQTDGFALLGFDSGLGSVVGARHVHEAMPGLLIDLVRHFLGSNWVPSWIELSEPKPHDTAALELLYGIPVFYGRARPAIAIRETELLAPNLAPARVQTAPVFSDLRQLVLASPPRTATGLVKEMIRLQLRLGDTSQEAVARRLAVGVRTLQRQLQSEGVVFRDLLRAVVAERAAALLTETDASIAEIAKSLGYNEVNSFRRAFRTSAGMSPTAFRALRPDN